MLRPIATLTLAALVCGGLGGCVGGNGCSDVIRVKAPYVLHDARELTRLGIEAVQRCDMAAGEAYFKRAISTDESYGPAHNNLGRIYFERREWKHAADAFHLATEFMPGRPEPLNNLGLVFESIGKLDDAIEFYQQAHQTSLEQPEFLANLVRARFRRGDSGADLREQLQALKFIENRPEWSAWVDGKLALSPQAREQRKSQATSEQDALTSLSEFPSSPNAIDPPDPYSVIEQNGTQSRGPVLRAPDNELLPTPLPVR